ncbi:MAG: hypothetical protein HQ541_08690 [Mariniphaga sp.]|nr:hypothetical protein [Mariniphaga sp.]
MLNPETDLNFLSEKINNLVADKVRINAGHLEWDFDFQAVTEIHTEEYDWGKWCQE